MKKNETKKSVKSTNAKDKPKHIQEAEALLAPLNNNNGIKNKIKTFWENMHHPIKNINWITFFIIMFLSTALTIILMNTAKYYSENNTESFGLLAKLESLKQSHDYYTTMATKDELLYSWIKSFSNWKYKSGGDPRYNNGDCVGSVYEFLKLWNSNVYFENVKGIINRCENLINRGELKKRNRIDEVRSGDLIIIQMTPNNPEHVGIVYDTTNGFVRFMDVNALVQTWGLEKYKFGTVNIYAIYEVSYSLWIGSIMKEINERK